MKAEICGRTLRTCLCETRTVISNRCKLTCRCKWKPLPVPLACLRVSCSANFSIRDLFREQKSCVNSGSGVFVCLAQTIAFQRTAGTRPLHRVRQRRRSDAIRCLPGGIALCVLRLRGAAWKTPRLWKIGADLKQSNEAPNSSSTASVATLPQNGEISFPFWIPCVQHMLSRWF